ncbi:MAG: hypothetical protein WCW35_01995 [Bacteroidota bacterium]
MDILIGIFLYLGVCAIFILIGRFLKECDQAMPNMRTKGSHRFRISQR